MWTTHHPMRNAARALVLWCATCGLGASTLLAAGPPVETDRDLVAGLSALQDGFYDVAQRRFETYLDGSFFARHRVRAGLYLAQALEGQGKFEDLLEWMKAHQGWTDDETYGGGYTYWLARGQYETGQAEEAARLLRHYEERHADDPYLPQMLRLRARALLKAARRERAIESFAAFQRLFPTHAEAPQNLLDWAGVLIADLRYREAEKILVDLIGQYRDTPPAATGAFWLSRLLLDRDAGGEARALLEALTTSPAADPDLRARSWLGLARLDSEATNQAAAVQAVVQAEGLARDMDLRLDARLAHARLQAQQGDLAGAAALIEQSLREMPTRAKTGEMLLDLADLRQRQGQFADALLACQHYLEAFSDTNGQARALSGKGWALWQLGRQAEAAPAFEKAAALFTEGAERERALTKAADAYFAAAQYPQAEEAYRRVATTFPASPRQPDLLQQLAETAYQQGDLVRAEAQLREIQSRFPAADAAPRALFRLARMHEERGQWAAARAVYDEFLQRYTRNDLAASARFARALVSYRTGAFAEAVGDLDAVVQTGGPEGERALLWKARALDLQGETPMALRIGRQMMTNFPDSVWQPDLRFWLAEHAYNSGAAAEAEGLMAGLARDYAASPLADDALYWAGQAAIRQDEYRRAIAYFNDLSKAYTNSPLWGEARLAQGDALTSIGEFSAGILAFDEVIKRLPTGLLADMARGRKGDCQYTLGADKPERYQEALQSYRAVMDSTTAPLDLRLQSEYKVGRCLEQMGRRGEAFEHYMNVVYDWMAERRRGRFVDSVWFTRSAFAAASLKETDLAWPEALRIYQRVVEAAVPASADARKRADKIRNQTGQPVANRAEAG